MENKKEYTHEDIKALSDFEHIRHAPEMYIGQTDNPTHLIYEVIDNALDESTGGHANAIGLEINDETNVVTIADNGRGIPFENNTVELITTKLFSGGKFKKGKDGVYAICSGLHGVGIVAVTALSEWMEIEIYRDNKKAFFRFENGKLINKKIIDLIPEKKPFSTQVSFKPSKKYFQSLLFDIKAIKNRMELASVHIDHLRLLLIYNGEQEIIDCSVENYFDKNLKDESDKQYSDIVHLKHKIEDEEIDIRFCWCFGGKMSPKCIGSVNLLAVHQGTHINSINEMIREVIYEYSKKEKCKFQKHDALIGFRCCVSASLYEPKYSSQTKDRLAIRKDSLQHLINPLEKKFRNYLDKHEDFKNILLSYIDNYRKRLTAASAITKNDGTINTRLNVTTDAKLRNCSCRIPSQCEIFIVEGQSASGGLVTCRNPKYHSLMPLKGKVMNVASGSKEYFKNKELVELINALGCGVENDCDVEKLSFEKIIISCDADADGCPHEEEQIYIRNKNDVIKISFKDLIINKNIYLNYKVLSYDEDKECFIWADILKIWDKKIFDKYVKIWLEDDSFIIVTEDHLILTERGYIQAKDLNENDEIISITTEEYAKIMGSV